jgi:6,7-dimethyl-8-ribityllumazine synthase
LKTYEGTLDAEGLKIALLVSRFNGFITEHLLTGAVDILKRHGAREEDLEVVRVPGTFELPAVARRLAQAGKHDGLVALGALIRGATPHFDLIAGEVTRGLGQVARESNCALSFGVITADTLEQAIDRAGAKMGNKGAEAAMATVELCRLYRELGPARGK